ncbi:sulfurtransferase TusA family protein [Devosia rhodophyticola]|uniref:Sulfurtransferase TusA family protein n=1 Tax=Devosia rhodophyticola TaxID=3026423 RepID=A0ABY7Z2K2_9HYPH|nr:sulfurtransferase TusA family protein [Devosia rhodophyticola]
MSDLFLIDARGLKCPLPVLKMEKRLTQLASGQTLTILATDPMAKIDIPLFCRQNGHGLSIEQQPDAMRFVVVKA